MQSWRRSQKKKIAIQKAYLVSCVNSRLEDLEGGGERVARQEGRRQRAVLSGSRQPGSPGRSRKARRLAGSCSMPAHTAAAGMRAVHRFGHWAAGAGRGRHLRHQPQFQGPHGIARCAMLSRQSRGGGGFGHRGIHLRARSADCPAMCRRQIRFGCRRPRRPRQVEILPGFPASVRGRLVFLPQDNLNTDGIYGKDYTYREDMTPEMMARRGDGKLRSAILPRARQPATSWSAASTSVPAPAASRR